MFLGLGLAISGSSGGSSPASILGSALTLWLRGDLGVTFVMSAVAATGTTPPAVTLTGTPAVSVINTLASTPAIEIDISTTGARGTATFQWKLNGSVQQTAQTTAATFALGTTGLTANFPVGTYTNDNVYKTNTNLSAWADQSATGASLVQATSSAQPIYSLTDGLLSTPALTFASASLQRIASASSVATGTTPTLYIVNKYTSVSVGQCAISFGVPNTNGAAMFVDVTGHSERACNIAGFPNDVDANNSATTSWEIWRFASAASAQTLFVNGASRTLNPNNNALVAPGAGIVVGSQTSSGASPLGGSVAEVIMTNRALTAGEIAQLSAYFTNRYGLAA
jgi:hypothetical protein